MKITYSIALDYDQLVDALKKKYQATEVYTTSSETFRKINIERKIVSFDELYEIPIDHLVYQTKEGTTGLQIPAEESKTDEKILFLTTNP